jgi:DNA-binding beta-propeller fold protein YncE
MVFSADGADAYVADKVSCDVRQIDTATLAVVSTVHWPSWNGCPYGLATGPEGNLVYTVTGDDHTLQDGVAGDAFGSVDFTTGQTRVLGQVGEDPVTVAVSADGTTAYVVDADTPEIDVVDLSDGSIRSVIRLPTS